MRLYFSLLMIFLITACGFKPMYSTSFDSESDYSLSEIRIAHLKSLLLFIFTNGQYCRLLRPHSFITVTFMISVAIKPSTKLPSTVGYRACLQLCVA